MAADHNNVDPDFHNRVYTTRFFNAWSHHVNSVKDSVCRIDIIDIDNGVKRWHGSGFHWGGGWVITNSHVLLGVDKSNPNVDMATVRITFPGIEFEAHDRLAIVVPVGSDDVPDLALIKLGVQVEYGRLKDAWIEWERQERGLVSLLPPKPLVAQGTVWIDQHQLSQTRAYTIHHGSASDIGEQQVSLPGGSCL